MAPRGRGTRSLHAGPDTIDDLRLTALTMSGRLREVDVAAEAMQVGGLRAVVDGDIASTHPVSSALCRWLSEFGRERDSFSVLTTLLDGNVPEGERGARALLGALGLATDNRGKEAAQLLEDERRSTTGEEWMVLSVQLGCRLVESGDRAGCTEVCKEVLGASPEGRTIAEGLHRAARWNLLAARGWDDAEGPPAMPEREPFGDPEAERFRLSAIGLRGLSKDLLDVQLAAPSATGFRTSMFDEGLHSLLGAWLQSEVWGEYGDIRVRRRDLGRYGISQSLLPYPNRWTHSETDASDLDLVRRSGDGPLTSRIATRWWRQGPLEPLQMVVDKVVTRPPRSNDGPDIALLQQAGDLLTPEQADAMVRRLVGAADAADEARSSARTWTVGRPLATMLTAAGRDGHGLAADAMMRWSSNESSAFTLLPMASSLRGDLLAPVDVDRLLVWADEELAGARSVDLAAQALLSLIATGSSAERAHALLIRAHERTPSLATTAGLLRSPRLTEDARTEVAEWLRRAAEPDPDPQRFNRWDRHQLLVAVADEEGVDSDLRDFARSAEVPIHEKKRMLLALSRRPEAASRVMDAGTVQRLEIQDLEGPWTEIEGPTWSWLPAAAAARAVEPDRVLAWLENRITATAQEQWQAASMMGPAAQLVPIPTLTAIWSALVRAQCRATH